MRTGQSQMVAQQVNQKRPDFDVSRYRLAVDGQFYHGHENLPSGLSSV
jgi:hypothetical protein